jgi:hypothetical protein
MAATTGIKRVDTHSTHVRLLCYALLAVTGLFVVVSIVVASAFFGNKFGMENVAAIGSPVFFAKDVIVGNLSVNNDKRLGVPEFIFQGRSKDYRFGMFLSVFDSLKTLSDFPVREDGSGLYSIVSVTGSVGEIQRLILLENSYYDTPVYVLGRGLTAVNEFRRNQERFIEGESQIAFLEAKSYPRSLINSEILVRINDALMSVFGYSFIGTPDCNCGNRVNDKNENTKTFKAKGKPIYPIALSIAGYFGMLAAWLSIGRCHRWWTGGLCFLGMIGGFCISVIGGLIALDRIAGVF